MRYRREVQVVFQDPYSSLSPRMRVGDIIAEPLEIHTDLSRDAHARARGRGARARRACSRRRRGCSRTSSAAGSASASRSPARWRRNTRLIVLDEPVSALDVSIRAQIMNQLEHLQQTLGVSYLFIGHDLATVAHISHRIAVMYLGQIVELADSLELCAKPLHPYTQALFTAALPVASRRQAREADDQRRGPERARSALGLPLSSALSACYAAMRTRGADPQRSRPAAHGRLPSLLISAARGFDGRARVARSDRGVKAGRMSASRLRRARLSVWV